jgi:predicted small secreted protein
MIRSVVSLIALLAASLLTAACGAGNDAQSETQRPASVVAAEQMTPSGNPPCRMFTTAEAARYIGEAVEPGIDAGLGTGCQWLAIDGDGDVLVTIVPAGYHEPPKLATGYKELPGIGAEGFVAPELGGWVAGTIAGQDAIRVSIAGETAREDSVVALLREALRRHSS